MKKIEASKIEIQEGHVVPWVIPLVAGLLAAGTAVAAYVAVTTPTKRTHYGRNRLHTEFSHDREELCRQGWGECLAWCHKFTDPGNTKLISPDGRQEAVFGPDGTFVEDPRDVGTFNFAAPHKEGVKHFVKDVWPWIKWGNSIEDTTTALQRLCVFVGIKAGRGNHARQTRPVPEIEEKTE